jgi:predicted phage replisome organizer
LSSEVKWIKLQTDIFDNRKIKQLERLPDGDTIIVIWLKILTLAGSINDGGLVYFTRDIPYTDQLLATEFGRPLPTIQMALDMFERFGMIEIVNDLIHVSNWERYQNVEGMEKVREQTRQRVAAYRERKALSSNVTSNVTVTEGNATDIDIEEDKEKDIEKGVARAPRTATQIAEEVIAGWGEELQTAVRDWLSYKKEKRQGYKETGLRSLLTQIRNAADAHGDQAVIDVIHTSMSSNYTGIVFDRLQDRKRSPAYASTSKQKALSSTDWDKLMDRI